MLQVWCVFSVFSEAVFAAFYEEMRARLRSAFCTSVQDQWQRNVWGGSTGEQKSAGWENGIEHEDEVIAIEMAKRRRGESSLVAPVTRCFACCRMVFWRGHQSWCQSESSNLLTFWRVLGLGYYFLYQCVFYCYSLDSIKSFSCLSSFIVTS